MHDGSVKRVDLHVRSVKQEGSVGLHEGSVEWGWVERAAARNYTTKVLGLDFMKNTFMQNGKKKKEQRGLVFWNTLRAQFTKMYNLIK